jgi:hypothetical protein
VAAVEGILTIYNIIGNDEALGSIPSGGTIFQGKPRFDRE